VANMSGWVDKMVTRLEAKNGLIRASFPFFIKKQAPVSKAISLLDYEVTLEAHLNADSIDTLVTVVIPITSLCPCSKKISKYGAHNQRSHVTVQAKASGPLLTITQLIRVVEKQASSELYGTLKRPDEKY